MPCRSPLPAHRRLLFYAIAAIAAAGLPPAAAAQDGGTVRGVVTRAGRPEPLGTVSVTVAGTAIATVTGANGRYVLRGVPVGARTLTFRSVGYRPAEVVVTVAAGETVTANAALEPAAVMLGDIEVRGASRAPERIVEAPAAISVVNPQVLENTSATGQAPLALQSMPGIDVVQSGVNDFNVNARGFNSSLNRRVLVLQDGRDLAIAFLGAQEWNGLTQSLADLGRVEVVRGPGSALYGANAFSGVVNITTPTAREIVGTKVALAAGELETFRTDLRHAGLLADGRVGYRFSFGYNRSDTWSRTRTLADSTSLQREYDEATDESVPEIREARPLNGQTADPTTGVVTGDRGPLENLYGSGRVDFYVPNGTMFTVDGGGAQVENEIFVTGIGRVQVSKAIKPYVRAAAAHPRYNVFGYWNSRTSLDPQHSLQSGLPIEERSDIFHVEGQTNWSFRGDRGRIVYGASYRNSGVNTSGTLMELVNDDRHDDLYSTFGQVEYRVIPQVRLVAAARFDDGDLIRGQFSPKGAVVFSPNDRHSIRFSVNRAFQTPNYSELFLRVPAGLPANFFPLEMGLRASPLGPALAGVPVGELFTTSSAVPVLALGNAELDVETVVGWEVGYKADIGTRAYVTLDLYQNEIEDFVTDLLPGVNPAYGPWTSPPEVPPGARPQLEAAVRSQLTAAGQTVAAAGLTRVNGNTAIVVSYTNAGEVRERGVEVGVGYQLTPAVRGEVSFTGFDFDVRSQAVGDQLAPNTPSKKASLSLSYAGAGGFDADMSVRLIDGYPWAAGIFQGYVPAAELVNLSAGYRINNYIRVHATATNLLDQERFQLYGGSVIGRRVLAGVTTTF